MTSTTLMDASSQLYQRGREEMEKQRHEVAAALFRASVDAFPHPKSLELLGECLLELDRSSEALIPLAAAAGLGNKGSRAFFLLAQALSKQGRIQDAVEKLDIAIAIHPQFKSALQLREKLALTVKPEAK